MRRLPIKDSGGVVISTPVEGHSPGMCAELNMNAARLTGQQPLSETSTSTVQQWLVGSSRP